MGSHEARALVSALEGAFRAALVSLDDVAADDLAFSFAQDIALADDLARSGGAVFMADGWRRIDRVAHDYLVAGDGLVPLDKALTEVGGDVVPEREPGILLGRLRQLARVGGEVTVATPAGDFFGRITKAALDHLQIAGRRQVAIPLGQVLYVRCARGGSGDVL